MKMNDNNNSAAVSGAGCGMSVVLLIVFVVLKLVGVIQWSWWLVIGLPFLIEFGLVIAIVFLLFVAAVCRKG